ncbi:hypothetical protein KC660_01110 [Candidatus Dojkabacteria bacterium]|uniref:Glycerophosphoryl diester phosphodiesterase membrane domain-containing protein n=1 Tax=Candidatus Dojkabacteria bacterium TaxID=2099670 RepID=A0A955RHM7_9BACT|nr:hypothetical protein [Candidatus Dojkabacteria bacterium]
MDHLENLKTAFKMPWKHKFLIVFGVILVLFSGSGYSSNYNFNNNSSPANSIGNNAPGYLLDNEDTGKYLVTNQFEKDVDKFANFAEENMLLVVGMIMLAILLIICLIFLFAYISNTAEAGLYLSVDQLASGQDTNFKWGWKHGSKYWLRLFALKFVLGLLIFAIVFPVAILIAIMPFLLVCLCIFIPVLLVLFVIASIVIKFAQLNIVFSNTGIVDSLKNSYAIIKANKSDVAIYWLVLFAVGIVIGMISMMVGFAIAIPLLAFSSISSDALESTLAATSILVPAMCCLTILLLPLLGYIRSATETYGVLTYRGLNNPFATTTVEGEVAAS